ncbi:hypothetical protein GMDG_02591 [Pseudogymnoascus destructans 20631-21]|uniref:RecA family profile 1 domain-containing protein n=1 Tax=Pseudogymnoascus destructans (strain ATCC MYA-4855 / 20631-21) TaxID=658429 RepID=L8G3V3_PSED2|nr:hypothetical protein GMDG_02591 [Pseudogymnoascus destructans 20631-21]
MASASAAATAPDPSSPPPSTHRLPTQTAAQALAAQRAEEDVKMGVEGLDALLGVRRGEVMEVFGAPGVGKRGFGSNPITPLINALRRLAATSHIALLVLSQTVTQLQPHGPAALNGIEDAPIIELVSGRKRKAEEILEGGVRLGDDDYGWDEGDEVGMPLLGPQTQGSEDVLVVPGEETETEEEEEGWDGGEEGGSGGETPRDGGEGGDVNGEGHTLVGAGLPSSGYVG